MDYLDGIDRDLVHKVWMLKEEAKKNGRKKTTIVSILNVLLRDALEDMDALRARFCAPAREKEGVGCPS